MIHGDEFTDHFNEEHKDVPDVKVTNATKSNSPLVKQESVEVYGENSIPPSVANNIMSVDYPPTKRTRFSLATTELELKLAEQIKTIFPDALIEYKPNKAEVADMTIWRDSSKQEKIGSVNFIHQDRQKDGVTNTKTYLELMFFNFNNKDEYDKIKTLMVSFFKDMDDGLNTYNHYTNDASKNNTVIGGKRRKALKKTHKKRVQRRRKVVTKRHHKK